MKSDIMSNIAALYYARDFDVARLELSKLNKASIFSFGLDIEKYRNVEIEKAEGNCIARWVFTEFAMIDMGEWKVKDAKDKKSADLGSGKYA